MRRLDDLVRSTVAGGSASAAPVAPVGVLCLAGADLPSDVRILDAALRRRRLVEEPMILNDTFAPLRAGTNRQFGISVVCGAGVNAAAVAPNGRMARFPGLGPISGDWGGSSALGMAALNAAVRARDGRGPSTILTELVPRHFGLARPETVTRHLYRGRIGQGRLRELAPVVFTAAMRGDAQARAIVDRLADELATMAVALARRLHMTKLSFDVVLAGGVFDTPDRGLVDRIHRQVAVSLPAATIVKLDAPPVLGAALLALDRVPEATPAAAARLRAALTPGRKSRRAATKRRDRPE